jgi:hypothetical protein
MRVPQVSTRGRLRPYFSYASNMVVEQMASRCPTSKFLGTALLRDHEFRIGRSGYATVVPKRGSLVYGVVWLLGRTDERALDIYEEVDSGLYRKCDSRVEVVGQGPMLALIYEAARSGPGRPRLGYIRPIVEAATTHGFPREAIAELARWAYPNSDAAAGTVSTATAAYRKVS